MICRHKLYHFMVVNTRFTAPLTRGGKTKFATIKWYNLCLQIIQSQTCYPLIIATPTTKKSCLSEFRKKLFIFSFSKVLFNRILTTFNCLIDVLQYWIIFFVALQSSSGLWIDDVHLFVCCPNLINLTFAFKFWNLLCNPAILYLVVSCCLDHMLIWSNNMEQIKVQLKNMYCTACVISVKSDVKLMFNAENETRQWWGNGL